MITLTLRNTRRYGGYVIHFGMVLIFIGLAGAAFNLDTQKIMNVGDTMSIGPYTLVAQTFTARPDRNYDATRATIDVLKDGRSLMFLYPERRYYRANDQTGTMVSIFSTARHDLYVVFAGLSPEGNLPVIHAYLNPLVKWIWFGGVIVVLGTGLALLPSRQPAMVLQHAGAAAPAASPIPHPSPQPAASLRSPSHSDD
jgi:cytochrome c-type biogenesis protein CcmF